LNVTNPSLEPFEAGSLDLMVGCDFKPESYLAASASPPACCPGAALESIRPMVTTRARNAHRSGPATLADVAARAGVSPMTVSRVVNGGPGVRSETRDRVMAAIDALKYVPNQAARRLAGSEQIRLGVLYSNPSAGYLSEFLVGLLNEASRSQVQLVVERSEGVAAGQGTGAFLGSGIDAVIIAPPLCDSPELIESVVASGLAGVLVASGTPDPRLCAVGVDDYEGAACMTRHLIALGHQRIGFITGRSSQTATACRLAGFRDAMRAAKLPLPPERVAPGAFTYSSGLDAAEALLTLQPRPTAVFASNDDMAAATVAVAHRMGIGVPGDLTVVGFDDAPIATTIWPELTTVRQPIGDMARSAVEMLVRQVMSRRADAAAPPQVERMPFELVRRQTDAAPRRRPVLQIEDAVVPTIGSGARRRGRT
jgi:LacI family transcriptional regulator